jgi:DNA modification methylase
MLIRADARLLPLQDACVDCIVTSPPYWGLRDYGTARWFGGDPACPHRVGATGSTANKGNNNREGKPFGQQCGLCGALRIDSQIGLEPTPEAYVRALVAVFANVRRVLKPEGTVWCNLGDSYVSVGTGTQGNDGEMADRAVVRARTQVRDNKAVHDAVRRPPSVVELRPKQLVGIPWRVAFALQADGWYLRSDIIWAKPNPMPESVTDRPTKAHEYLFLLTKSERYFYDAAAIAEPLSEAMLMEMEQGYDGLGLKDYEAAGVQNPSSVKARIIANARRKADASNNGRNQQKTNSESERRSQIGSFNNNPRKRWAKSTHMEGTPRNDGDRWRIADGGVAPRGLQRNRRSVWNIATLPYAGAHFATMPEKLVEPCILAGSPLGGLVLDPFVGSGTVGAVAERLGRRWVGVDLSYHDLAKERTAQRGLRFEEATT